MDAHVVPDTTRSTWTKEKDDSEVRTVMGWISIFRLPMIDTQKKQEGGERKRRRRRRRRAFQVCILTVNGCRSNTAANGAQI